MRCIHCIDYYKAILLSFLKIFFIPWTIVSIFSIKGPYIEFAGLM